MEINAVMVGSEGEFTINASVALEDNFDNSDVKIVYILARHIDDNYFSSVVSYEYEDFDLTTSGSTGSYIHTFSVDSSWDAETISGYVMVQKWLSDDSEIYQAAEAGSAAVSMTDADFGPAYIGSSFTQTFVVANIGDATTDVDILVNADGYTVSGEMSYSLEPDEVQNHIITFLPTAEETYSGLITVTTSIPGFETNTIVLNGSGFPDAAPVVENLTFDGYLMKNYSIDVVYDFVDSDDDAEGDTVYQWYISDDGENWSEFTNPGGDILSLYFTAEYIGKYFKFTILPYDEHMMPGEEVVLQTTQPVLDLVPPSNFAYTVENGNDIVLTWDPPIFPEVRGLFGYKIKRGSAFIATITDTETLTYTDENVEDGTYTYVIKSIFSPGGLSTDSEAFTITIVNGVPNENDTQELIVGGSSYPNPFNTVSSIDIQAKGNQHVQVAVYNLKGQLINTLADKTFTQGVHNITWDGRDQNGNRCSDGLYFYKIITPEKTVTKKAILMK
jgi:hypothetical protein